MTSEEKLQSYEKMQAAMVREYGSILTQMEELKAAGKTKSVTYQTLLGKKMMYKNMISMYELYDLTVE